MEDLARTRGLRLGNELMNANVMTTDEALHWVAEIFEARPEEVTATSSRNAIRGWDSLGMISLMAGLDERFNIQVTDTDMRNLQCVNDILDLLRRRSLLREDSEDPR